MTSNIVKAADSAQLLSFVPRLLGYQPVQSLVVIPFHGTRSLGAMRVDLPRDTSRGADSVDRVASTVLGMVCRLPDADGIAAIAYTDAIFEETGGLPHAGLAEALERQADACGLRIADLLCVAADAWGSYLDPAAPVSGRPLAELAATSPELAGLPEPAGDQASGAELPASDLAERERVGRALIALGEAVALLFGDDAEPTAESQDDSARHDAPPSDLAPVPPPVTDASAGATRPAARVNPLALATVCRLDDLPGLFEDALGWDLDTLDPYDAAAMIWCLSRPSLRDIALVQWSGDLIDGDDAFDAQLRWEAGEEYPSDLAMRMWGEGDQPDPQRLESALGLVRRVAAVAPRASRPGPLAMCAWLSWALGRSTHADAYASRACEIDPEHGLSEIILSFVRAGHLPDWAFRRRDGATLPDVEP